MLTPQQLWSQYEIAIRNNDLEKAQAILKKIHNFKAYPTNGLGCSRCRKTL